MKIAVTVLLLAPCLASSVFAQNATPAAARSGKALAPSFSCAKASSDAEKAICRRADLAQADVAVAKAYQKVRSALDPKSAPFLVEDQKGYLATLDVSVTPGDNPEKDLLGRMTDRARFLKKIKVPAPDGLAGEWGNVTGGFQIEAAGDGFHVDFNTVQPERGNWVCDGKGNGRVTDGALTITIDGDPSTLKIIREGPTLKVEAIAPPGQSAWTPEYCGHNGSVEGHYFFLKR